MLDPGLLVYLTCLFAKISKELMLLISFYISGFLLRSTISLTGIQLVTLKNKIIVSIVLVRPHSPIVVPILSPWVTARQINLISLLPLQIYMSLPLRSLLKIDFNYLVHAFLH